ncbi:hypothetical protein B0T11DRAFT_14054 [Plectosphaerella cucumerina]|uniref:Uncharacterized protein n=1 Tax=Plectosphaerella cucumerina TaxID=40658 RepID=A0A8K0TSN3_9PEZI|nr:hypothetical protein B0T11DRAFT_14054 [Plectosphaerella cucumerina]
MEFWLSQPVRVRSDTDRPDQRPDGTKTRYHSRAPPPVWLLPRPAVMPSPSPPFRWLAGGSSFLVLRPSLCATGGCTCSGILFPKFPTPPPTPRPPTRHVESPFPFHDLHPPSLCFFEIPSLHSRQPLFPPPLASRSRIPPLPPVTQATTLVPRSASTDRVSSHTPTLKLNSTPPASRRFV